jgi:hypothetical protein
MGVLLTGIQIWLEALSNFFDGVLHLRLLQQIIVIHFLVWMKIWEVYIILRHLNQVLGHIWAEYLTELCVGEVTLVVSINQFHHAADLLWASLNLDRLQALLEITIRDEAIFVLIKLSEHMVELAFTCEHFVLHLIHEALDPRVVDILFIDVCNRDALVHVLWRWVGSLSLRQSKLDHIISRVDYRSELINIGGTISIVVEGR